MRIQHNIMAMNAYRNYTNNVSAMQKNLEKLSSGYKINRAGDDAAGLAISEKMRAQITGLETAQKNAKDGISLVQTAEGALTEVHDMLNRMVELSTQSANGTYDNETDRYQLQKEMDQLRSEIDRIADSSNFNGIKLLDGSLSGREAQTIVKADTVYGELTNLTIGTGGQLPAVTTAAVSTGTILHVDKSNRTYGTEFSIDLHNAGFTNKAGAAMTITIGNSNILITGTGGKFMNDEDLAKYIVDQINSGESKNIGIDSTLVTTVKDGSGQFTLKNDNNQAVTFTVTLAAGADGGDTRLVFRQVDMPTSTSDTYTAGSIVKVDGVFRADSMKDNFATSGSAANLAISLTITDAAATKIGFTTASLNDVLVSHNIAAAGTDLTFKFETEINGQTETFTISVGRSGGSSTPDIELEVDDTTGKVTYKGQQLTQSQLMEKVQSALNKKIGEYNDEQESDVKDLVNDEDDEYRFNKTFTYDKINTVSLAAADLASAGGNNQGTAKAMTNTAPKKQEMKYEAKDGTTADWNWKVTYRDNVTVDNTPRLASTYFDLTKDMVVDGASIKIGNTDYTFTTDESLKTKDGFVYIGDLGPKKDGASLAESDLYKVADRLATAAKNNGTYTVGSHQNSKTISVVEIEGQTDYDLKTEEGIEESLGFRVGNKTTVTTTELPAGKNLMLQIGDTSDSFNQLKVAIDDMHSSALGIGEISIADQDSASSAIQAIKDAINKVSDVRGTLGATQNRLDHTINNLSVMTENIQDAESTIRDTDIAEEMMAYTKNNILIQSAQAMLAQANQVPQGVLQLLG